MEHTHQKSNTSTPKKENLKKEYTSGEHTSQETLPYEECQPEQFYLRLAESLSEDLEIRKRVLIVCEVFRQAIEQYVSHTPITFTGLFSKLDYIIKQRGIPASQASLLHFTRKAMRSMGGEHEPSPAQLHKDLPQYLQATTVLISTISGAAIPLNLQTHFPRKTPTDRWKGYDLNLIRCIVRKLDGNIIEVEEEQHAQLLKVCYDERNMFLTRNGQGDWSYLEQIITPGAQINLVRVRMLEGLCMPELIIYEPDYLVNVTTIASCFETYAESPYVSIINRLKPQPNTEHIHLGNLTGQFLDDTIHGRNIPFSESMTQYFQMNALEMLSCEGLQGRQQADAFYEKARAQQANIKKLIGNDLRKSIVKYDTKHVTLEPTFFSESLGIQGRLDFLYRHKNQTVIIEQKSGKGEFIPLSANSYDPEVPKPQEKHLVQLLLYRALLVYEFNMHSENLSHIMLLYSRYHRGLVSVGQMPALMLRAIRMRNLLAWCEIHHAHEGYAFLATLSPEKLNRKQVGGKLWNLYTRPELEHLLQPIHQATPLERAYYLRFMQFLAKERLLAKVGSKTKEDAGFASKWLSSLEEKRAAGNIYEGLILDEFRQDGNGISGLTARFPKQLSTDTSNFRRGDIIFLYPYKNNTEPRACAQMVIRGSIEDITPEGIRLMLRNSQTDPKVFAKDTHTRWAIEHDLYDSSVDTLYSGLHRFLSVTPERRALLLSQREPVIDSSITLKGDYGTFNALTLRSKQARELFLIIGPPGTGKTSFGMLNLVKEQLQEKGTHILLISYTNRAVDEMCGKLQEENIEFLRIGSPLSCSPLHREQLLSSKVAECRNARQVREIITNSRIFCGTTAALNANPWLFSMKHFHLTIVDEASQILEPHVIGLLSIQQQGKPCIDKVVLIGDHKQLPAVVQQSEEEARVTDEGLRAIGLTDCRQSLFERLLSRFRTKEGYDPRFVYMLTRQGRMHKEIAAFPSQAFYAQKLQPVPLPHQTAFFTTSSSNNGIVQMLTMHRLAFVCSEQPTLSVSPKTNDVEARMIAAIVYQAYLLCGDKFDIEQSIGVIVPYRNQISAIRNAIDQYGIAELHGISIDTVERFQGSQRDYIIYGFTIQQRWQLTFLSNNTFMEDGAWIDRKLNVAMTRARLQLTLIGNPELLAHNVTFLQLMHFARSQGGFLRVATDQFCKGEFTMSQGRGQTPPTNRTE
ncbi:MAG: ATP-dependent helicase [Bacteroidaceae bacterium]